MKSVLKNIKFISVLAVFSSITGWGFYADHFAIEKTNRYRPLANGWVSSYADIHLREDLSFTQKIKKTISEDSIHGRFRPAFFFYVTSSYALSPLIHGRSAVEENRPYNKLMNGDLRLFSYILPGSVTFSFLFMSLLIYHYTKEVVFSFIPLIIPKLTQPLAFTEPNDYPP